MGLLDMDPQSMANLSLAGGLLSPGSFGQGITRGIAGYQSALSGDADLQLKKTQLAAAQQEQQMRNLAMRRTMQQLQFGQTFLGDTQAPQGPSPTMQAASSALGSGAQSGSFGPTTANATRMDSTPLAISAPQRSRLASLTQDQIAAGVVSGVIPKEFVELWTNEKFGRALPPGWKQNLDGSMNYVPDPTKGVTMGPDGKTVQQMPGAAQTLGALAAATKGGELDATNARTPVPVDRLDRMPGLSPFSTVQDLIDGGRPPAPLSGPLGDLSPRQRQLAVADMRARGQDPGTMLVNGVPITTPKSAFKTPADLAGDKVESENLAKLRTQPALDSATTSATELSKSDQAYANELNGRVAEGFNLKRRNGEILRQIQDYSTGIGGAELRTRLASSIQNMLPDSAAARDIANKINGGSVVSAQTLHNLVAGAMITSAISALQGQGRLNRAEVQTFQRAAENPESDPGALRRIIEIQNRFADQDFEEQQARAQALKSKTYNPLTWQADFAAQKWKGMADPSSVFSPATPEQSSSVKSGPSPLPANPTSSSLKIGSPYVLPNGKVGVWDGFKFKGQ